MCRDGERDEAHAGGEHAVLRVNAMGGNGRGGGKAAGVGVLRRRIVARARQANAMATRGAGVAVKRTDPARGGVSDVRGAHGADGDVALTADRQAVGGGGQEYLQVQEHHLMLRLQY